MAKKQKKPSKYEEKFVIDATFEELVKVSVEGNPKSKRSQKKADKNIDNKES